MSKLFKKNVERIDTFQDKQLLEETEHEMTITMTGSSLENAVSNVFQVMRKQIFEEIRHPIIHMEASEAVSYTHRTYRPGRRPPVLRLWYAVARMRRKVLWMRKKSSG